MSKKELKYPVVLLDPAKDSMKGKRFDGNERIEDEIYSYNGNCICGMPPGVIHHHQYEEKK